jgi:PAS domain S-box-containing protein
MTLPLERKIQLGLGGSVAILVVVGAAALRATSATLASANWVAHTLQVRADLEAVFAAVIDAETGVRGYVITGDTAYLAPLEAARGTLDPLLVELRTLTADNPAQQRRLDSLKTLLPLRFERLQRTMDARRTEGAAAAGRAIIAGQGQALTQRIRGLIVQMQDEEGRLLLRRSGTFATRTRDARIAVVSGMALALGLTVVASVLIGRELKRRRHAEEALGPMRARLQHILTSSTVVIYGDKVTGSSFSPSWVSENVTQMTGYDVTAAMDPAWWPEHLHPDDRARVLAEVPALFRQDRLTTEYRFRHADGSYRWVRDECRLLRDASGAPLEVIGAWVDITEHERAQQALRESEERHRLLFERNPLPAWVFDLETLKFLAVNDAAVSVYGYSRDEFLAMTIADIRPPEDVPTLRAMVAHTAATGSPGGGAWRHRKKDGTVIEVEITAHPLVYDGRRADLVLAQDITVRQRAELALRASEERFRALAASANDAIVSADSRGCITYFNPGAEQLFGYAAPEVTGQPLTTLMPDRFREAHRAGLARYVATGVAHVVGKTVELSGRTKDGREFPLELSLASWKQGSDVGFTGILRDITERLRAADALHASEARFRLLVESVRDYAIYMLDPTGHVVTWNRGAEQIKGYAAEEIVGQHFSRFYAPEDAAAGRPGAALDAATTAGRYEEENWRVRKDGSRFWADVVITAVRDEWGTLLGFAKVTRDLSERRRAEAALQARSAQLEAANKELEAFSYSVSHDLRAPLRSIDGFSQALQEDYTARLDDEGQGHLRRIRAATARMAQIIDALLDLARVSRAELRSTAVDLAALAQGIIAELRQREPGRAIEFVCADQAPVRGDPALLRIVIENLLGNAWKFTAPRRPARIEFGMVQHDGAPAYFVRDNGPGFDMTYAGKLFGAFQRLHGAAAFEGTGIGLATVQRIIHRHGGRVWAESAVDQGATFYFTV